MTQPTPTPERTTLDDPIAFAHQLYSRLGGTDIPLTDANEAAFVPFKATAAKVAALHGEQTEGRRLLDDLEQMFVDLGIAQHTLGMELGVQAEVLRQTLIAARAGTPRIPGNTP